ILQLSTGFRNDQPAHYRSESVTGRYAPPFFVSYVSGSLASAVVPQRVPGPLHSRLIARGEVSYSCPVRTPASMTHWTGHARPAPTRAPVRVAAVRGQHHE